MTSPVTEPFAFEVPATAAHLGPGFGVLAVALDLPVQISVELRDREGHTVERRGTAEEIRMDARHDAILRGLQIGAAHFSIKLPPGLHIVADSRIPAASGLGSHTASFAAGIGVALRFAKTLPSAHEVLDVIVALGADPGHAGAALVGGFTAVCQTSIPNEELHFRIVPQTLADAWRFVVVCPDARIATADMQRILPPTLPHSVTPRTTSRLLGLLDALAHGNEEMLAAYLFDEVHVPFRRRLVPGIEAAMDAGREAGAAGVTIAGHGPGLIALTTNADALQDIGGAMTEAFDKAGQSVEAHHLQAQSHGALPD